MTHSHVQTYTCSALPPDDQFTITDYPSHAAPYHIHTDTSTYRLQDVHQTYDNAYDSVCGHTDSNTDISIAKFGHVSSPLYGVYTAPRRTHFGSQSLDGITHQSARTIVSIYRTIFEHILEASSSRWNKELQLSRASHIISNRVNWKEPVPDVTAALVSNLILGHPLPNANHRSSLALAFLYLDSHLPETTFLPDANHNNWLNLAIRDSKRLVTTRRNTALFRDLVDAGITTAVRKNNLNIQLTKYTYTDTLRDQLETEHVELWRVLIKDILYSTENTNLVTKTDKGMSVFTDRLEQFDSDTIRETAMTVANLED